MTDISFKKKIQFPGVFIALLLLVLCAPGYAKGSSAYFFKSNPTSLRPNLFKSDSLKASRDSLANALKAAQARLDSLTREFKALDAKVNKPSKSRKSKPETTSNVLKPTPPKREITPQNPPNETVLKDSLAGEKKAVAEQTPPVYRGKSDNSPEDMQSSYNDDTQIHVQNIIAAKSPHPGQNGTLTEQDMKLARIAWKYFENNYQPMTGMVNNVDNFPNTTMWDAASSLAGLVAAYELNIIDKTEFDRRMLSFWQTMLSLSLFRDEMPNKVYHTITKAKVGYTNEPGEIGFSALDLGRFLIWARIIKERYPAYSDLIDSFILRWDFCKAIDTSGQIQGAMAAKDGRTLYLQEGRLGYEEYGAKGFQLWGFSTAQASKTQPYSTRTIYGIEIPYDSRDPRVYGAHNYVVSESYVLDGVEMNWDTGTDTSSNDITHTDPEIADFAQRIYRVQEERFKATGQMTARSEHQLDGPPYFVYDAVYTDGYPWNTITEDGKYVPQFAAVALKAALGLWALWDTPYTDSLYTITSTSFDPNKGFYEGVYEKDGTFIKTFTANNNGIILSYFLYKAQGKILRFTHRKSLWDMRLEILKEKDCVKERLSE